MIHCDAAGKSRVSIIGPGVHVALRQWAHCVPLFPTLFIGPSHDAGHESCGQKVGPSAQRAVGFIRALFQPAPGFVLCAQADEERGDDGPSSANASDDDGLGPYDDNDGTSVRQRRGRRHHRLHRHQQRQPDTSGTAAAAVAATADPCGAIAAGVSRFRVPTLRLQHEALAPHTAWANGGGGGGAVRHVLLEVAVPPGPDESGRRASAAPARDAAAMLRAAVAAASRCVSFLCPTTGLPGPSGRRRSSQRYFWVTPPTQSRRLGGSAVARARRLSTLWRRSSTQHHLNTKAIHQTPCATSYRSGQSFLPEFHMFVPGNCGPHRQQEAALHVPPFQGRPRAPPPAAAAAAPAAAGISTPTAAPELIELRPLGGSRLPLGGQAMTGQGIGAAAADGGSAMGGEEVPTLGPKGLRHRHGRTGSGPSDAAALPPLPPTAPHPASAAPTTAATSPVEPSLRRSSFRRASSPSPPPRSVTHSPVLSTRTTAGVPGGRSHRPAPPPLPRSASAHSLSAARARGHSRSAGGHTTDSDSDADLEYDKLPPVLSVPDPSSVPYIVSIESYSQPPRDLYTATAFLDFLSFIYAAIFYQLVASSARTLYDIADADRRLPLDYLAALMLLFALMVSERAAYMLGWPAAKAALHVGSQVLLLGWTLTAYWQSAAVEATAAAASGGGGDTAVGDGGVRSHLRVFTLLRCLGFCLGEPRQRLQSAGAW